MSMAVKESLARVAFSPREFAQLFGKSQTWGYRQIYAGKVKAITAHGRTLIPAGEVDAILKTAGIYDGMKPKPGKTKDEIKALAPQLATAWQSFLTARRQSTSPKNLPSTVSGAKKRPSAPSARQAALARLSRQTK